MKLSVKVQCRHLHQTLQHYLMLIFALETIALAKSQSSTHLELAKNLMSSGRYSDALPHYNEAISSDPNNFLTYFKRATVFLALNRPKSALEDLDKVLELKSDFSHAISQRASLHIKMGNLDEAQVDFERVLSLEPSNQEAEKMYQKIERLKLLIKEVQNLIDDNQHDVALHSLNKLIENIPWNTEILKLRAKAFEKVGQPRRAINDYRNVAKLTIDAKTYLNIAKLCYNLGEIEESLNSVRECLKLDPDNKACMEFYRPAKKLNNYIKNMIDAKDSKDNDECYTQGQNAIDLVENKHESHLANSIKSVMCHCLARAGDTTEGLKVCDEALSSSTDGIEGLSIEKSELLCDKADLLLDIQDYSEALKLFQESQKIKSSKRAKQGIEKTNRLKKQKAKRDYYKILGVNRSAGDNEINRAYRKLAAKWHPDKFQDENEKKRAQAKFMDIADAKAVLTDPEKRQIYDQGEDPLDPESKHGSSSQHHGFYSDFNHFSGGVPFQFKFNFG